MTCNRKRLNPEYKESKNKGERKRYRIKTGKNPEIDRIHAIPGTGHIDKRTGYKRIPGYINELGYRVLSNKDHPNASKTGRNRYKVFEHTVVMAEFLGRPLRKGESVHHKNGIRHDNRLENLELWVKQQPPGQRVKDVIEWAVSFLESYGFKIDSSDAQSIPQ